MKKTFIAIFLPAMLVFPGFAEAADISISTPQDGAKVGSKFVFAGSYDSECANQNLPVYATGYNGGKGLLDSSGYSTRTATSFRYNLDLTKPTEDTQQIIQPGRVVLEIGSGDCEISATVEYQKGTSGSDADDSTTTGSTPSVSPTPTPTPTTTPQPAEAEEPEGWLDNLDSVLVLLIGAVAGGGATGLAEYSWIRHRRKHGLK